MTQNATPRATFKIFAPMLKAARGEDGRPRLRGIASSTVVDRHGDTMAKSALDDMLAAANRGLTIFLNHSYMVPEDVAGTVESAYLRQSASDVWDLHFDIRINDKNKRATDAWDAIENGTQLGLSIGAMIPEGGAERNRQTGAYLINHVDLIETSLVGVPANPRSWVEYAVKALRSSPEVPADEPETDPGVGFAPVHEAPADGVEKTVIEAQLDEEVELVVDDPTLPEAPALEADVADATVNIETPFANISIDTGNRGGSKPAATDDSSQEAPPSEPETEEPVSPWSAIGLSGDDLLSDEARPAAIDAITSLSPSIVASLRSGTDLLRAVTSELIETRRSLAQTREERDAAVATAQKVMTNTRDILDKLARTPVGRKATYVEAEKSFDELRAVYGEDFINVLRRTPR